MIARLPLRRWWLAATGTLVLGPLAAAAEAPPWETVEPGGSTGCADGSAYRFHVREADPSRLLVFFNGGGACWNAATCDPDGEPTYRVHAGEGSGNDPRDYGGAFDLDNPANPFRGWSQLFVSYCSGDVHLGNATTLYAGAEGDVAVRHSGRANADAALADAYARFPAPEEVVVAGGSAGALASPVYAAVLAGRYPEAQITQLGGGGAGYRLPPPTVLWESWGVIPALPAVLDTAGVSSDTLRITDLYRLAAAAAPGIRFHSYDNAYDAVQEQFLALLGHPAELLPGLDANLDALHADLPRFRSYVAGGEFHTLLRYDELYTRETAGVRAVNWLSSVIDPARDAPNVHCSCDGECRGP
ncbi:MAG: pectin acetylesterase-family hydrolase [Pseudohaliea sp.]